MTTAAEILARVQAAGIRLRAEGAKLIASPRERLTDELRAEIRAHKAELLAALARTPEPAHAGGPAEHAEPDTGPSLRLAPDRGADCMRCANLIMRCEVHEATRRVFWWRCSRGHVLLEARNYGERVLLAPPGCDVAGDFKQWREGRR